MNKTFHKKQQLNNNKLVIPPTFWNGYVQVNSIWLKWVFIVAEYWASVIPALLRSIGVLFLTLGANTVLFCLLLLGLPSSSLLLHHLHHLTGPQSLAPLAARSIPGIIRNKTYIFKTHNHFQIIQEIAIMRWFFLNIFQCLSSEFPQRTNFLIMIPSSNFQNIPNTLDFT